MYRDSIPVQSIDTHKTSGLFYFLFFRSIKYCAPKVAERLELQFLPQPVAKIHQTDKPSDRMMILTDQLLDTRDKMQPSVKYCAARIP
jgi:hypothetical protein